LKCCRLFRFWRMWQLQNDPWSNCIDCNWVHGLVICCLSWIDLCPYFFLCAL
jgi:hypothetical protein